jgi:hypothetical protein
MRLLPILALLSLGGCNVVVTQTPMFTKADGAGGPGFRPGVWRGKPDPGCAFDEKSPLDNWPACANGALVDDDAITMVKTVNGERAVAARIGYVLTSGEPRILQLSVGGLPTGLGLSLSGYFYGGVRSTKTDDQGRIIAYTTWFVACGPPPPQPAAGSSPNKISFATLSPFPGLVMDKAGQNCTPNSVATLRNAAVESAKLPADSPSETRWVRDGDR